MSAQRSKRRMFSIAALAVCFLSLLAVLRPRAERLDQGGPVYVGFIEDDRRELVKKNDSGPAKVRVIMPAFVKDSSDWKTIDALQEKVRWTVAFDGRTLGEVESRPDSAPEVIAQPNAVQSSKYIYAVHAITTPAAKVPSIGKPSGNFDGAFGGVVRRPLVVVSKPNFYDPDGWKRAALPEDLLAPVRTAYRQAYHHLRQCDERGEPLKSDWDFPDSELTAVRTYGSNKRSFIVETRLKHQKCVFDVNGNEVENLEGTQWFYLGSDHVAHSLGADLQLVDAGDYDGDGKSEVIFFFGNTDTDHEGYTLFYDDFRNKATLTWTYHS